MSVAVTYRGRLEHGVVYDPLRQEIFAASQGRGAQLNERRIRVSRCRALEDALLGTGFPFRELHHLDTYLNIFRELLARTAGIRRAGSAALDLAYVASGRLDGFWEYGLQAWDMAAGSLLIQEAGGFVTDFDGGAQYLDNGNIVAGGPKIHNGLLKAIKGYASPAAGERA